MKLITKRLSLNEVSWDDLERVHQLHSIPEVDRYNTLGLPKSLDDTRAAIEAPLHDQANEIRSKFLWAISQDGHFVGIAGMNLSDPKYSSAEIYYKLMPQFWGKGIATEAASELLRFGFDTLGLHRITAGVATENVGSIRVLEKIGMIREGLGRQILPIRGQWIDNFFYAILASDPRTDSQA